MPIDLVPSATTSAIGVSPMSAQPVQPMRNAAPEQMQQSGAVVQKLGEQFTDIGQRIQNQLDDAIAKTAETGFLQNAIRILNGDGKDQVGYLHTRGADAQNQYGDATTALAKAKQSAVDSLSSDFQKSMFARVANQHLASYGAQMADHRFQQVSQYSAKSAHDRADTYAQLAANSYKSIGQTDGDGNPTGDFNNYWNQAVQEAQTEAKVGFGADSDSPQAQALVKDKTSAIVQGVITRMMNDHAYPEAKKFYDDQLAKGNIEEKAAESMGNAIKTNYDRESVTNNANKIIQASLTGENGRQDPYMAVNNAKGLVEKGNLPIWNRPVVQNDDGSHSTEYSTSFADDKGHEVLVPTVVDGKFLTPDGKKPVKGSAEEKAMFKAAWNHYEKTGENLGKFDNVDDEEAYSKSLHNRGQVSAPTSFLQPVQGGSITSTFGVPRPGGKTHDGIDIAVPVGTAIQAPADGKVLKVWNDDKFGGGLSMQIQHDDGSITGYAHLSAANYKAGEEVTQGQTVGLTGKSGNATGPVLHYTMRNPDGQRIDPGKAGHVHANPQDFTDPGDLQTAIAMVPQYEKDPILQREIVSQLESQQRHFRVIDNETYETNKQTAVDQWYKAGGDYTRITPSVWGRLRPADQFEMKKGIPIEDNVNTVAGFILHPETLTVANVQGARGQLSKGRYLALLADAQTMQTQGPAKVIAVGLDKDQLETTLANNGLQTLVAPKAGSTEFQQSINLRTSVRDQIDAEQTRTGKQLDRDQKQKIYDSTIMNTASIPGTLWGSKTEPIFQMKPEQLLKAFVMVGTQRVTLASIPSDQRAEAMSALRGRGMPVTEQAIANLWVQAGKPGAK